MKKLALAFTPCPNDIFMFFRFLQQNIELPFTVETQLMDIQTLNMEALKASFDISKLSVFAYGKVSNDYIIINSGAALGYGCGPLLLGRSDKKNPKGSKIAIPGHLTTAHLLLKIFLDDDFESVPMVFDEIMPALQSGKVDYGVVIHEGRFTYNNYGLNLIQDLGVYWEKNFQLPIPLGVIAAKRNLQIPVVKEFEKALQASIEYAWNNQEQILPYAKKYAQEMDRQVILNHIKLYVTQDSRQLSDTAKQSIKVMLEKANQFKLLNINFDLPLFT